MPMVTRYFVARVTTSGSTEYHDGNFWSDLRCDAEEFRTEAKAQRRADRVGGGVFKTDRFSELPDFGSVPRISLVAGHNERSRLEQHFAEPIVRGADLSIVRIAAE